MRHLSKSMFIGLALLSASTVMAATLTPGAVISGANQLNGQKISVTGIITDLMANTSSDGKQYRTFRLCDANACLSVYTRDTTSTFTPGAQLTASGRFWAVRHEGYKTRYNELVLPSKTDTSTTTAH